MVSAVAASVMSSGAWVSANSSPTRAAADWSSAPTTMRSGCRLSATAVPSRRNSGLETTATSWRPSTRSTTRVEPTGTVDLLTMIGPGQQVRSDLPGHRLDEGEVGRAVVALGSGHAEEDELGAGHCRGGADHEAEAAGGHAFGHQLLEMVLDDGHPAALEHGHLGLVGVAAGDPVAEGGEGGGRGQPDVADADHGHVAAVLGPVGCEPAEFPDPPAGPASGRRGRGTVRAPSDCTASLSDPHPSLPALRASISPSSI